LKKHWYDYLGEPPAPQQNANGGSKPTPKPVSEAPASVKNAAAGRHPDDEVIGFTEEAAKLFIEVWLNAGATSDDIKKALKIEKMSQWKQKRADADKAMADYLHAKNAPMFADGEQVSDVPF